LSPFPAEYKVIANDYAHALFGTITVGQGEGLKAVPETVDIFTMLIGVVALIGFVVMQLRSRRTRLSYNQHVEAMPLFIVKLVVVAAVVLAFTYALARDRGFPLVLIVLGLLILAYQVITNRTVFGRRVYAVGGNLAAAKLSGVNVVKTNF